MTCCDSATCANANRHTQENVRVNLAAYIRDDNRLAKLLDRGPLKDGVQTAMEVSLTKSLNVTVH